ncbi:SOS response-associated peptidase family protein [Aminobacter anthyllidis]|uniref:SOS response-associated peptidase family protein n=1 Tax=Aminobacter anthyllidis TaxID=1035067 RepID=A0A9X1D3K9_9HYPH|nr:SOS response-associated peptidase family protein [Aminobacter anthyllidis]MBT1155865.1 SOS response-associated peptidase family protein [Aminobacter anthyllidis]
MCNAYEQHVKWVEYVQMMQALELNIPTQQTGLDLRQADDIRISDMAPVMRATANDNEIELTPMNFGLPSEQPKRGPVFNFRSDGRSFSNSKRCLIPASGFFEFTGTKYPKTKHTYIACARRVSIIAVASKSQFAGAPIRSWQVRREIGLTF